MRYVFNTNTPNYIKDTDGNVYKFVNGVNDISTDRVKFIGRASKPVYFDKLDDYPNGVCPIDGVIYNEEEWEC